ncbi:MAG TPA: MgtC/SapB family protein [Elainellaceae cyanobacterium]
MTPNSDLFAPLSWSQLTLRLLCALIAGAIIGAEREAKHKPAGLRTNMLVSFGSALFVLVPIETGMASASVDALSRAIQGIITGVGFVGAGTILRDKRVRGLTSATATWVSAALGIATGCGLWQLGLISAAIAWVILRVLEKVES